MNRVCCWQDVSIAIFILFLFQSVIITPAYAQMDWLKSGKELLDTVSKSPQEQTTPQISNLTDSDIASGLKDALRVGTERVVGQLGKADGFNADPAIHIPLPDSMLRVKQALDAIGLSAMMDDLELKLNRAAEAATPPAKKIFWDSIESMSMDDVTGIYNGPDDAATRYFHDIVISLNGTNFIYGLFDNGLHRFCERGRHLVLEISSSGIIRAIVNARDIIQRHRFYGIPKDFLCRWGRCFCRAVQLELQVIHHGCQTYRIQCLFDP